MLLAVMSSALRKSKNVRLKIFRFHSIRCQVLLWTVKFLMVAERVFLRALIDIHLVVDAKVSDRLEF